MSRTMIILSLVATMAACGSEKDKADVEGASPVVARVGDRTITRAEFEHWLAGRPGADRRSARPGGARAELESLIDSILVEQELARLGLIGREAPDPDSRVGGGSDAVEPTDPASRRALLFSSFEDSAEVSETELRAQFDTTRGSMITSRIHLRQIVVADEPGARAVHERVTGGEPFEALAAEVSVVPTLRQSRGDLGVLDRDDVPMEIRTEAFSLVSPSEVSEPFPMGEQWALLQLVSRENAVPASFEQVRPRLLRELRREKANRSFEQLLIRLREEAGVVFNDALLAQIGPTSPVALRERVDRPGDRGRLAEPRSEEEKPRVLAVEP